MIKMVFENLNDVQTMAILCNQWGDSGKGKIVHYYAEWADVIARCTGGNNAGHTIIHKGQETIFHLIPVGIVYDGEGKMNLVGNGTVIDLDVFVAELDLLDSMNLSYNHLMLSRDAHVIMPYHIKLDKAKNQSLKDGGIGSTGRGIGPCYSDKVNRRGIRIRDLLDKDTLQRKIEKNLPFYPEQKHNIEEIIENLQPNIERIKPLVRDTITEMHRFVADGKLILLEGAQGLLLSIEFGTRPYITASDCSLNGTATGVGLSAKVIDLPIGLIKYPIMTRVGGGPFPTELGNLQGEEYCKDETKTKISELEKYKVPYLKKGNAIHYDYQHPIIKSMMNSDDDLVKAAGIRLGAAEFGATTGRLRRVGWVDAKAAKYAVGINGPNIILTKVDCFAEMDQFNICFGYENQAGHSVEYDPDAQFLSHIKTQLKSYEGYGTIQGISSYSDLPRTLTKSVGEFENFTECQVMAISNGPKREQVIFK